MSSLFKSPKVPAAPDAQQTINQQAQYSLINQLTPYGNLVYGSYDANGNFVPRQGAMAQQIQESDFQKQLRGGQEGLTLDLLKNIQGQPMQQLTSIEDLLGGVSPINENFNQQLEQTRNAVYQQGAQQLQPEFNRQREALMQQLANQGLPIGSKAYEQELNRLEQSQGQQLNDLSMRAVSAGNELQNQLFGQQFSRRGQSLQEMLAQSELENQRRNLAFSDIAAIAGLNPQFQQMNTPTVDAAGIINQGYNNQLARYGQQQANRQGQISSLTSIGAIAAAPFTGGGSLAFMGAGGASSGGTKQVLPWLNGGKGGYGLSTGFNLG